MKDFQFLKRRKFASGAKNVIPGDTICVTYTDECGVKTKLVSHEIQPGEGGVYDEAAIFTGEVEGRKVLGGMIMEQQDQQVWPRSDRYGRDA